MENKINDPNKDPNKLPEYKVVLHKQTGEMNITYDVYGFLDEETNKNFINTNGKKARLTFFIQTFFEHLSRCDNLKNIFINNVSEAVSEAKDGSILGYLDDLLKVAGKFTFETKDEQEKFYLLLRAFTRLNTSDKNKESGGVTRKSQDKVESIIFELLSKEKEFSKFISNLNRVFEGEKFDLSDLEFEEKDIKSIVKKLPSISDKKDVPSGKGNNKKENAHTVKSDIMSNFSNEIKKLGVEKNTQISAKRVFSECLDLVFGKDKKKDKNSITGGTKSKSNLEEKFRDLLGALKNLEGEEEKWKNFCSDYEEKARKVKDEGGSKALLNKFKCDLVRIQNLEIEKKDKEAAENAFSEYLDSVFGKNKYEKEVKDSITGSTESELGPEEKFNGLYKLLVGEDWKIFLNEVKAEVDLVKNDEKNKNMNDTKKAALLEKFNYCLRHPDQIRIRGEMGSKAVSIFSECLNLVLAEARKKRKKAEKEKEAKVESECTGSGSNWEEKFNGLYEMLAGEKWKTFLDKYKEAIKKAINKEAINDTKSKVEKGESIKTDKNKPEYVTEDKLKCFLSQLEARVIDGTLFSSLKFDQCIQYVNQLVGSVIKSEVVRRCSKIVKNDICKFLLDLAKRKGVKSNCLSGTLVSVNSCYKKEFSELINSKPYDNLKIFQMAELTKYAMKNWILRPYLSGQISAQVAHYLESDLFNNEWIIDLFGPGKGSADIYPNTLGSTVLGLWSRCGGDYKDKNGKNEVPAGNKDYRGGDIKFADLFATIIGAKTLRQMRQILKKDMQLPLSGSSDAFTGDSAAVALSASGTAYIFKSGECESGPYLSQFEMPISLLSPMVERIVWVDTAKDHLLLDVYELVKEVKKCFNDMKFELKNANAKAAEYDIFEYCVNKLKIREKIMSNSKTIFERSKCGELENWTDINEAMRCANELSVKLLKEMRYESKENQNTDDIGDGLEFEFLEEENKYEGIGPTNYNNRIAEINKTEFRARYPFSYNSFEVNKRYYGEKGCYIDNKIKYMYENGGFEKVKSSQCRGLRDLIDSINLDNISIGIPTISEKGKSCDYVSDIKQLKDSVNTIVEKNKSDKDKKDKKDLGFISFKLQVQNAKNRSLILNALEKYEKQKGNKQPSLTGKRTTKYKNQK